MGTIVQPFPVYFFRLFAQGEGYAKCSFRYLPDFPKQAGNAPGKGRRGKFTALQHHRTVAVLIGKANGIQNLLVAQVISFSFLVGFTNTTVIAILAADIGEFDQSPEIDPFAYILRLDFLAGFKKPGFLLSLRLQQINNILAGEDFFIEYGIDLAHVGSFIIQVRM